MSSQLLPWQPDEPARIPARVNSAAEIATAFAQQLAPREIDQIVSAYNAGSFEMMSAFVWSRTMAVLRTQLTHLGMEFIGEMLGRADVDETSSIDAVSDVEAIQLAEELGIATSTDAMRLRHAHETLSHFLRRRDPDETAEMTNEEAVLCVRACVQSILSQREIHVASAFADLRRALETRVFSSSDPQMQALAQSPYFYVRTTLSVLLALAKSATGAQLENGLGNINTLLPLVWESLRQPEKWQTGQTYAEVYAAGRREAVAGLKKALTRVRGFDFVPENLRSATFTRAASRVIEVHSTWDNFYNEPSAMKALSELGTSIPMPAFHLCLRATMCVRMGNQYGRAWGAQEYAKELLDNMHRDRWEYFLNECLPIDAVVLEKLTVPKPRQQWFDLVREYRLGELDIGERDVRVLVDESANRNNTSVSNTARRLVGRLGKQARAN